MSRLAPLACLLPALALCQTNLQFQEGAAGRPPEGWFVLDIAKGAHYAASWQREGCRGESPCAWLAAAVHPPAGSFGTLMQTFDARRWRGRRVFLRGWVRLEPKEPGDHAQMLLHVSRPNLQPGFVDNMADRPITSEEWRQFEVRGEVAADAESVGIGLTLYGAGRAWFSEVEFGAIAEEASGPEVDAAREAIQQQYARMDSAFVRGKAAELGEVLMPGAEMRVGVIREPLLPAIEKEIAKGSRLTARSEVAAVRLDGGEAFVMVRRDARDPQPNVPRSVVTSHRDTWVRTPDGWRMRESIEVSYHWVLPATGAEEARAVAAELKTRAVPPDNLAAFGAAVGDARLVALGEAAHGTREFSRWKQRLTEYLVTQKGFRVVVGAGDAEDRALLDRLHAEPAEMDGATPEAQANSLLRLATVTHPQAKIVWWTDNAHARDALLREKFGRRMYAVGFAFHRGEVRAVGVEQGESRGLGVYTAQPSPEGSGDAVLSAAGMPEFFLNMDKVPFNGALERWLSGTHLFHDLGAYWVLDDPEASLQPEELSRYYNGLLFVEALHAGG